MDTEDKEFETHNIYLAAYFIVSGCKMVRKRKLGTRVYFVFTSSVGSVQELREAFFSGQAKVPAHQYSQQIIAMKNLCLDGREKNL
jgi:hypothetical protein